MKKLILGLVVGLLMGSAGVVSAIEVGERVSAIVVDFDIYVDGEKKELDAPIINLNGTTFLPLRTVANILGRDVVYRADDRAIELNTPKQVRGGGVELSPDFSRMDPFDIERRIQSYENMLEKLTDESLIIKIKSEIAQMRAYLDSIDFDQMKIRAEIEKVEESMGYAKIFDLPDDVSQRIYQGMIQELEQKKADLEAQLK